MYPNVAYRATVYRTGEPPLIQRIYFLSTDVNVTKTQRHKAVDPKKENKWLLH